MSKHPTQPGKPDTEGHGEEAEVQRVGGGLEFFRRNQKAILYSAGLFALVFFSVTGPMIGFFQTIFSRAVPLPSVTLADGRKVDLTTEDYDVARALAILHDPQRRGLDPVVVMPPLGGDEAEGGESRLDTFAMLRRLAIETGIDASDDEVDRAIQQALNVIKTGWTPAQLAQANGFSLAAYRRLVSEQMRIGTFLRLAALGIDTSDASLAGHVLEDKELVTLQVASLDNKDLEKRLREKGVTDQDLQKWIEGLSEMDRIPYQDTNRVALRAVGLSYADFDPALFEAELKGKTYGDEQIQQRYDLDRESRYRSEARAESRPASAPATQTQTAPGTQPVPTQPSYVPLDAALKTAIQRELQAEDALRELWNRVQLAMADALRPQVDARTKISIELEEARKAKDKAEADLKAAPEKGDLKEAAERAKAAFDAKEKEYKAADEAVATTRKGFDAVAAFAKELKERKGLRTHVVAEPRNADGLKELGDGKAGGLGTWKDSFAAVALDVEGDLSATVQRTADAAFVFQVTQVIKRPLKDFAEIKEKAASDYFVKQADAEAKTKGEALSAALLRLGKEQRKAEVEKIEKDGAEAIARAQAEWETAQRKKLDDAKARLAQITDRESMAWQAWARQIAELEKSLADPARKQEIETRVKTETEQKVKDEARKSWPQVLEAAATEAGFAIATVGPHLRDIASLPRFQYEFSETVRFLFQNEAVRKLKEGECTDVLTDTSGRRMHLAVLTKVEKATLQNVSRRQFLMARDGFVRERLAEGLRQSFSREALEKRYKFARPQ
ncbi:MAG: hypothetical protein IT458_18145 [Planctomycetes bacterium]|nr:hypothetical protein [Planctomycetota bacterium]